VTYLITFACYGSHLHGDQEGSVDRKHHLPGSPLVGPDAKRVSAERLLMEQPAYRMDSRHRETVLASMVERCEQQSWSLLAAHVRTNHVHLVVEGEVRPERIMNDLKSHASRSLNRGASACKRWARHGSTRWLWEPANVTTHGCF
jgi:REP element-mobilizing transposase RayT